MACCLVEGHLIVAWQSPGASLSPMSGTEGPGKLIQDSVCCSHLPVVVSRKERGLHLLACELSASIWSRYLFLSTGFIYLSQNMRQEFDSQEDMPRHT